MNSRFSRRSSAVRAATAAALLGLALTATAADATRPQPVKQRMVHTCDRQDCYNAPLNIAGRSALVAPELKAAPVGGQRMSLTLPGMPSCGSTAADLASTSWILGDHVTYMAQSGIPVPLGSTHTSLTYSARTFVSADGAVPAIADAGYVFSVIRMRRSGSGDEDWWIASATSSNPVSSETDKQYFWSNLSQSTLVDLSELPGGTGVPSGFDIEVRHYVAQTDGFADEAVVCAGELLITL